MKYLATVYNDKFTGMYFDLDTITDQMITDAKVNGVTFIMVDEPLVENEDDGYGAPTVEQITASAVVMTDKVNRAYLDSTDYYAVRLAETGKAMPEGVQIKRQAARDAIVD